MRLFALLILFMPASAFSDEREECQIALVDDLAGQVDLVSPKGDKTSLVAGGSVQPGDLVRTSANAWVDLRLCDGTGLRIGEEARFYYVGADNSGESFASWAFELVRGTLRAAVVGDGKSESVKMRVRTPSASLGVRGTELVIDALDSGKAPTALHTLEGEVLMGPREDFEKLATLKGSALISQFEPVGAERMSVIRSGEAHPLKAAKFQLWEFKAANKKMFARNLPKKNWGEIRSRFKNAHQELKQKRAERGLFERQRDKIEKKMAPPGRPIKPAAAKKASLKPERIQEQAARDGARTEHRQERLQEKLRSNQEKTNNKRERKGWEKRRNNQPASPRIPRDH